MNERPRKRLGEILVSMGFVTGRAMQQALRKQAKMREAKGYSLRIGALLLSDSIVTEQQLATALAYQFETEALELVGIELELGLMKEIPQPVWDKHAFVPVRKTKDSVRVAADDVLPREVCDGLRRIWGAPVQVLIAPATQLQKVRGWCKQHRRRLMQGQLERVTLPATYFENQAADPESTIGPGQMVTPALLAGPGVEKDALPDPPQAMTPAETEAIEASIPPESVENSRSGARSAARRARRTTGRTAALGSGSNPGKVKGESAGAEEAPVEEAAPVAAPLASSEPGTGLLDSLVAAIPDDSMPDVEELALEFLDIVPERDDNPIGEPAPPAPAAPEAPLAPATPASAAPGVEVSLVVEVDSLRIDNVPPLSRVLVALPTTLDSLLRELQLSVCETLTLAPRGQGADVIVSDEEGSRVSGAVGPVEYQEILQKCMVLLELPAGEMTAPARQTVHSTVEGEAFTFRLTALPSSPPTLSFSAADREGWVVRRQVQQETGLIEGLTRRVRQRRGLVLITGDVTAPVSDSLCGLLSALRRSRLRIALFTSSPTQRVREVTSVVAPPERVAGLVAPQNLLAVTETGLDLLAFDLPLSPEHLRAVAPLAAAESAVLLALRERDSVEAVLSLVRAQVPPALLGLVLEVAISIHRADRLCPGCRREVVLTEEKIPAPLKNAKLAGVTVSESPGCALCQQTGVRGAVVLHEVFTWDRAKGTPAMFALDRKAFVKRSFELGLVHPLSLEARKALLAGSISFTSYMKLLGLVR